ncbi:MAG: hypothetical protein MZV70_45680 [Desulfobacterales bacterium]|nr:hypothetical protein [Desulfobacterales bacterium]
MAGFATATGPEITQRLRAVGHERGSAVAVASLPCATVAAACMAVSAPEAAQRGGPGPLPPRPLEARFLQHRDPDASAQHGAPPAILPYSRLGLARSLGPRRSPSSLGMGFIERNCPAAGRSSGAPGRGPLEPPIGFGVASLAREPDAPCLDISSASGAQ